MKKKSRQTANRWKSKLTRTLANMNEASGEMSLLSKSIKNKILLDAARKLETNKSFLLKQNAKDLRSGRESGLSAALLDRLTLTDGRVRAMADGVRAVASLADPIGQVSKRWRRPNGLRISRVVVPLGVILIIYESRPNVTVECASLCIKSGNTVLLRGGREAFNSNRALASIFTEALQRHRLPKAGVSFVDTVDRAAVDFLLHRDQEIQLVIPRGGEALIRKVASTSRIPVIKHYQGICHVYVDKDADIQKAVAIAFNAKVQRPSVCNAMETLLVHEKAAARILPPLGKKLREAGCEVRGDRSTRGFLPWARKAKNSDYGYEYLDKVLAIKVVKDINGAIRHIRDYGSGHTDAIVTKNRKAARLFTEQVDSSSVMVNASTRFADGFEYGFGAEIGISTDKIHARGPMGLEGLTSYKYVVEGQGQIRT
ncbi:MAG: glutamate-5-semialdehyde dehydrogenase [Candidatus Omnitrophota bacterium]|nr:glutamate-5-semialdehyde dehydrogenase [Candidatus Omnitrophota bacterium]